jgi:flagellar biosynthesis protein FlhA
MPKWPMLIVVMIAAAAFFAARRRRQAQELSAENIDGTAETSSAARGAPAIEVVLGRDLGQKWLAIKPLLADRISNLRSQQEKLTGFSIPAVLFQDGGQLGAHDYEILLHGSRHAAAQVYPDKMLAVRTAENPQSIPGIETRDPAFHLPALWIDAEWNDRARDGGYTLVDPVTVLMTHLGEVLRAEAPQLLSRSDTVALLEGVRARQPGLVEELIPSIMTVSDVQRVLQNLLAEDVSIRNIDQIGEVLVDLGRGVKDHSDLTEVVRQRLSHGICQRLRGNNDQLSVLSLDPRIEGQITESIRRADKASTFVLEPRLAEQLIRKLVPLAESMMRQSLAPVLLCNSEIRRHLKTFTRRTVPKLAVLSVNEIPHTIDLKSFSIVKID